MTAFAGLLPLALSLADPSLTTDVLHQYDRWERRLRARVTELHQFPAGAEGSAGTVAVKFAVDSNGRAVDPVIEKSSGHAVFDKAAVQLVRRLGWVGQAPSESGKRHTGYAEP